MAYPRAQAHHIEEFAGARARLSTRQPGDHLRQDHIFQRGELGQQMVVLIDETETGTAQLGAPVVVHTVAGLAGDAHFARGGAFQKARDLQQRRLARPGRPDKGDDLTRLNHKGSAGQHLDLGAALLEGAAHPDQFQRGATHIEAPRPDRAAPPATPDKASPAMTAPAPARPR